MCIDRRTYPLLDSLYPDLDKIIPALPFDIYTYAKQLCGRKEKEHVRLSDFVKIFASVH